MTVEHGAGEVEGILIASSFEINLGCKLVIRLKQNKTLAVALKIIFITNTISLGYHYCHVGPVGPRYLVDHYLPRWTFRTTIGPLSFKKYYYHVGPLELRYLSNIITTM